jgi:hypothetical protein
LPPAASKSSVPLTTEPIDRDWCDALERISDVAADTSGVPSAHIDHLTPTGSRRSRRA